MRETEISKWFIDILFSFSFFLYYSEDQNKSIDLTKLHSWKMYSKSLFSRYLEYSNTIFLRFFSSISYVVVFLVQMFEITVFWINYENHCA